MIVQPITTLYSPKIYSEKSIIYFEEIKTYLAPLYKYKQGNCHNVMHFASLVLDGYGLKHQKIWIYAPCRYKTDSNTPIRLKDPNKLSRSGFLNWGYHVGLLVEIDNQKYVFDYFLDENNPLDISEWIKLMELKTFHIDIVDADKYLFFSEFDINSNQNIFKGNYFEYQGFCRENFWIEKGLAINQTAFQLMLDEQIHFTNQTQLSNAFRLFIGSVNNFECVVRDNSYNKNMTKEFQQKHQSIIKKYRNLYFNNLENWIDKINCFV
jgi:hypothetical protein